MDDRHSGTGDNICPYNSTANVPTDLILNNSCEYNKTGNDTGVDLNRYYIFDDVDPDAHYGCIVYSFAVEAIVIGLTCALGLLGNSVAQWVFWKDKVQTASLLLFRCLLVSDSVVLLASFPHLSIPAFIYFLKVCPGFFDVLPYIQAYVFPLGFTAHTCSVWFTVLIGYSRYLAVVHPHITRISTLKLIKKYFVAVLVAVAVFCGPKFFSYTVHCVSQPDRNSCVPIIMPSAMEDSKWYRIIHGNILYAAFMTVLPQGIMIYHYAKVLLGLRSSRIRSNLVSGPEDHVAKAIVYLVISTLASQMPALATQVLWNVLSDTARDCGGVQFYLSPISNALVIINSALSFPVQFFFNTRFRELIRDRKVADPSPESIALTSI